MPATDLDQIVSLCKRRGFVYQSAEIYGGFRSTYDYGPLGSLLLRNVKDAWIRSTVRCRTRRSPVDDCKWAKRFRRPARRSRRG